MDLPTPGSPPRTVTDPATRPPPRTLSSSPIPVGAAAAPSGLIEPRGNSATSYPGSPEKGSPAVRCEGRAEADTGASCSTRVFHSPQAWQRPDQRDESCPHALQRWIDFGRVMVRRYESGVTLP